MKPLFQGLSTSVGRKFLMGVTGLLLCVFLVIHLAGNLLLYVPDGGKSYNAYTHALHEQEALVKVGEVGLTLLFVVHIYMSLRVTRRNQRARKVRYALKESKLQSRILHRSISPDTWMFVSGVIVLAFLLLHLADFTFQIRPDFNYEDKNPFQKAVGLLQTPLTYFVYIVGCLVLGMHLSHGFSSAFKSLGLSHPQYDGTIKWLGVLFGVVIAVAFASFPIVAPFLQTSG